MPLGCFEEHNSLRENHANNDEPQRPRKLVQGENTHEDQNLLESNEHKSMPKSIGELSARVVSRYIPFEMIIVFLVKSMTIIINQFYAIFNPSALNNY